MPAAETGTTVSKFDARVSSNLDQFVRKLGKAPIARLPAFANRRLGELTHEYRDWIAAIGS